MVDGNYVLKYNEKQWSFLSLSVLWQELKDTIVLKRSVLCLEEQ